MLADGDTSVTAQPNAAITGSVANQAVQINQGSLSTQSFASGHYCNSSVISIAPYVMRSESMASSFSSSNSVGGQISLSMPLDGGAVELCKELARRRIEKERIDYELVRIKECVGIYERGFMINPSSPFYSICADVVPIASVLSVADTSESDVDETTSEVPSPEPSSLSSEQSL